MRNVGSTNLQRSKAIGLLLGSLVLLPYQASAASFSNGSFEMATISPASFGTLYAESTVINGWTVTSGSIDLVNSSFWQASSGSWSIDLTGAAPGSIAQTFDTVAGSQYLVTFDLAGNPRGAPTEKKLIASAADAQFEFSFSVASTTVSSMGYESRGFLFTANAGSTTLRFSSMTDGAYGAVIDNVAVSAVPEPSGMVLFSSGLAFLLLGLSRNRARAAA